MRKTPNLDLPIYDTPNVDKFKVADWNKANENIDYVFGEFKNNPNVNAIDITARQDIIKTNEHLAKTQIVRNGATSGRPQNISIGEMYYDNTIQKPIWWNGTAWKDANGTIV